MKRPAIAAVLSVIMALVASGCLWGIARDAETGEGLHAYQVWWFDEDVNLEVTETDENGLFVFEGDYGGEVPVIGEVRFRVVEVEHPEGLWCPIVDEVRLVHYDDNPRTPVERQDFDITCVEECPCYEGSPCWPWCQHIIQPPPPATPTPRLIPLPVPRAINTPIPPPH